MSISKYNLTCATDLLVAALTVIEGCVKAAKMKNGVDVRNIKALSITTQRNTLVVWDRYSGKPYCPAIIGEDRRTAKYCAEMRSDTEVKELVKEVCGLFIHPAFPASKLRWLQDNCDPFAQGLKKGSAYAGTLDSWLIWNLTGRREFVTDVSNAASTMLLDLSTLSYSPELVETFGINMNLVKKGLPKVLPSSYRFGKLALTSLSGIPIASVVCDVGAALIAQGCINRGTARTSYNEESATIVHTGEEPVKSKLLLTTVAYQISGEPVSYALESHGGSCGSTLDWLVSSARLPSSSVDSSKPLVQVVDAIANDESNGGGLIVVPALNGLPAPYWVDKAQIMTIGEQPSTRNGHYVYATLEGVAQQVADVLRIAGDDLEQPVGLHHVDGELTVLDTLLQIQADVSGIEVCRSGNLEPVAFGAALLAARQIDLFESTVALMETWQMNGVPIEPVIGAEERERRQVSWENANELCFQRAKFITRLDLS